MKIEMTPEKLDRFGSFTLVGTVAKMVLDKQAEESDREIILKFQNTRQVTRINIPDWVIPLLLMDVLSLQDRGFNVFVEF